MGAIATSTYLLEIEGQTSRCLLKFNTIQISFGSRTSPGKLTVRYKSERANGITFVFKYESDYPELLHIYVRHLKEPDDAIDIFINGQTL
jgi:hypothetical protein